MAGMKLKLKRIGIISIILVCAVFASACSGSNDGIYPGDWGYDRCVIYDALGGIINSRGSREVYYMNTSSLSITTRLSSNNACCLLRNILLSMNPRCVQPRGSLASANPRCTRIWKSGSGGSICRCTSRCAM